MRSRSLPDVVLAFAIGVAIPCAAAAEEPRPITMTPPVLTLESPSALGSLLIVQQVTGESNTLDARITLSANLPVTSSQVLASGFQGRVVELARLEATVGAISPEVPVDVTRPHRVNVLRSSLQGFHGFAIIQQVNGTGNRVSSTLSVHTGGQVSGLVGLLSAFDFSDLRTFNR